MICATTQTYSRYKVYILFSFRLDAAILWSLLSQTYFVLSHLSFRCSHHLIPAITNVFCSISPFFYRQPFFGPCYHSRILFYLTFLLDAGIRWFLPSHTYFVLFHLSFRGRPPLVAAITDVFCSILPFF